MGVGVLQDILIVASISEVRLSEMYVPGKLAAHEGYESIDTIVFVFFS